MSLAILDQLVDHWNLFADMMQQEPLPPPFQPLSVLIAKYIPQGNSEVVLDVGCETGKNTIPLIQAGYKVILLDIAPKAIEYTLENLTNLGLLHGVAKAIIDKIEDLDPAYGPFKCIVGTYTFSYIPPNLFEKVMKANVLSRVKPEGYFVGGFFSETHTWKNLNPHLTFVSKLQVENLLKSMGFSICEITLNKRKTKNVPKFHTIEVIAVRS